MITWMQRHKKYLIVTIWISTIAFVGAGFVGWGQYNYGEKAGTVAKVGNIDITAGDLQKSYSNLYMQYMQMFQGNFDEEKAKSFGLKKQALEYLAQQALVLNLAQEYKLTVSDSELFAYIKQQEYFSKNGSFDKATYKDVLSKNNLTIKEYEENLKKELLIKKTLALLSTPANDNEMQIMQTVINIADKIEYKLLTPQMITINSSDDVLKPYWEKIKTQFMQDTSYEIRYIVLANSKKEFSAQEQETYFAQNRSNFKGADQKLQDFASSQSKVVAEMLDKESKKEALKSYIAYKKGDNTGLSIQTATISQSKNQFSQEAFDTIATLSNKAPIAKPILVNGSYTIFELVKTNKAEPKSYEDAKASVLEVYASEQKAIKLQELAKSSIASFSGKTTGFITGNNASELTDMPETDAGEFLSKLFTSKKKRDFITLTNGNVIMYNILEQKLLDKQIDNNNNPVIRLKKTAFDQGLLKNLQNRYKTEILIQGL